MRVTFDKIPLKNIISVTNLYTMHYYNYTENFSYDGEIHDFWELVYIDNGEVTVGIENMTFVLKQNQAILHQPNVFHKIKANNQVCSVGVITFDGNLNALYPISHTVLDFGNLQRTLFKNIIEEGNVSLSGKQFFAKKEKQIEFVPFASLQVLKNYIELLLIYCFRKDIDIKTPRISLYKNNIVQSIIRYLEQHINEKTNLETLSTELRYSQSYISKTFKRCTGTTIIQYLLQLRIKNAKELIALNTYSFKEISEILGFDSIQYFSSQFKKYTRMTPSQYAKSVKISNLLNPPDVL